MAPAFHWDLDGREKVAEVTAIRGVEITTCPLTWENLSQSATEGSGGAFSAWTCCVPSRGSQGRYSGDEQKEDRGGIGPGAHPRPDGYHGYSTRMPSPDGVGDLETEIVDLVLQYRFIVAESHEHIASGIDPVQVDCIALILHDSFILE